MGSYGGYGHAVRAATVVDRSMKEVEPGVFASKLRIPVAGRYNVAFLLDNPRVLHCFDAEAAVNPELKKTFGVLTARFELPGAVKAGDVAPVKVRLTDPVTNEPRTGLRDVTILYHRTHGGPKATASASEIGGGVYQASLSVPAAGTYYAFVTVPSLDVKPKDLPFQAIVVRDAPALANKASR
ncbi:MAG TPA: cytochrome D1, partial [Anaeromyxobacter sp.]